jgi:hypothetical protein
MSDIDQQALINFEAGHLAVIRREINIRSYGIIKGIMGNRIVDTLPLRLRCECSVPVCEENIEVSLAQRRELRRNYPHGFIVIPLHTGTNQDITLCTTSDFKVVEKIDFLQVVTDL